MIDEEILRKARQAAIAAAKRNPPPDEPEVEEEYEEPPARLPNGPVMDLYRRYTRGDDPGDVEPSEDGFLERAVEFALGSRSIRTLHQNEATYRLVLRALAAMRLSASMPFTGRTTGKVYGWCADYGYSFGTIRNIRTVIGLVHMYAGLPNPCADSFARAAFAGVARALGTDSIEAKDAITVAELQAMVREAELHPLPLRAELDRTILLVTFAAGLRRGETVALRREHVRFLDGGMEILVHRSKTNQTNAQGVWVERSGTATCPVAATERWIAAAKIRKGPLFRRVDRNGRVRPRPVSGWYVARAVTKYADAVGLRGNYGAHSLRAGCITEVIESRTMSEEQLMAHTRQEMIDTLLRYFRPKNRRTQNLTKGIGL